MAAHFIHKKFSQVVFAGFLGLTVISGLTIWKPKYSTFYCMSKVKRL
jgi:hypothetical protein